MKKTKKGQEAGNSAEEVPIKSDLPGPLVQAKNQSVMLKRGNMSGFGS